MPMIEYGMFDTSSLSANDALGYQMLTNGGELYGWN